ncbi:unnamed protein product [Aphanomyces euteiches]
MKVVAPSGLSVAQAVAVFSLGAATALASHYFLHHGHAKRRDAKPFTAAAPATSKPSESEEALEAEQLSRIRSFFGDEGFEKIQNAFVIVVGLGGVGSHAAHMLARSGVKHLRLIDFDNVTLSSLNRHAVATRADVGLSKAQVLKRRLLEIVPQCNIEALPVMFEEAVADDLLDGNPTYILDCIDDVTTKTALLSVASAKGLKVITATSAGAKADPTRIHIGSLADSVRDNLATKIRYFLKKKQVDASLITTVYSSEKSRCKLLPLDTEQADNPNAFGNVENFRIRVIPVLGTMPAMFGQSMAAYVLTEIAGSPINPENVAKLGRDQRNKYYQRLQQREKDAGFDQKIAVDKDDMDFIYQEVWKARSSVSGIRCGGFDRMFMSRWRKERPLNPGNIVLLTTKELQLMDSQGLSLERHLKIWRMSGKLHSAFVQEATPTVLEFHGDPPKSNQAAAVFAIIDKLHRGTLTHAQLVEAMRSTAAKCKLTLYGDVEGLLSTLLHGQKSVSVDQFVENVNAIANGEHIFRPTVMDPQRPQMAQGWSRYQPPSAPMVIWWLLYAALNAAVFTWKFNQYEQRRSAFNLSGYSICVARAAAQVNLLNGFFLLWPVLTRVHYVVSKVSPALASSLQLQHRTGFHIAYGVMFYISGWIHVLGQCLSIFYAIPHASNATWAKSALSHSIDFAGQPKPDPMDFVLSLPGWTGVIMTLCSFVATSLKIIYWKSHSVIWNKWAHGFDLVMFFLTFVHGIHHWLEPAQAITFLGVPTVLYIVVEVFPRYYCTVTQTLTKYTKTAHALTLYLPKTQRFDGCLPGTFLRLNVPALSRSEWHPFSITGQDEHYVIVHIQPCGDWTRQLYEVVHPNLYVRIDGPIPAPAVDVVEYPVVVLIGAGFGVTPYMSVLQHQMKIPSGQIIYLHWMSNKQEMFRSYANLLEGASSLPTVHIQTYLTGDYTKSRPDETKLLKLVQVLAHVQQDVDLVTGLSLANPTKLGRPQWHSTLMSIMQKHPNTLIGIFFCGPPALKTALAQTIRQVEMECNQEGNSVKTAFHPEVF